MLGGTVPPQSLDAVSCLVRSESGFPKLRSSKARRALLSAFLLVTLLSVVAANLPDSRLRGTLLTVSQPYLNALGLDQRWNVFAPNPRRQEIYLEARITDADGRVRIWHAPRGGPLLSAYWDYHWRKWVESAIADAHRDDLWEPTASWIARKESQRGRSPREVTLIRRWRDLKAPGTVPENGPWRSFDYWRPGAQKPIETGP